MDRTIPYLEVCMTFTSDNITTFDLPKGYTFKHYQDKDELYWAEIMVSVTEFSTEEIALEYFNNNFKPKKETLKTCLVFIENEDGKKIGTGMLWDLCGFHRLHYIAIEKNEQGKKLSKPLISYMLNLAYKNKSMFPVYLTTQTWSYRAIRIYQSFGFEIIEKHPNQKTIYDIKQIHRVLNTYEAMQVFLNQQDLNTKTKVTIGVIAPSSPSDKNDILMGKAFLENLGFHVVLGKHVFDTYFDYLAGFDQDKIDDFHTMFLDSDVDMIMCLKGGYGTPRISGEIEYDYVKTHPKPFIGFSDITLLLNAISFKTNQVTYHGPMVVGDFTSTFLDESYQSFLDVVLKQMTYVYDFSDDPKIKCLYQGVVSAKVVGGNLSLLDVLAHQFDVSYFKDKILFIEEVNESVYRIDRLLQGLKLAGILDAVSGFIIGTLSIIDPYENEKAQTLFLSTFLKYQKPILYGCPFGHDLPRYTLPIGKKITLDATHKKIIIT